MVFEIEEGVQVEDDILIRIRHFLSSDIRYPVLRLMLSPLMIFTNFYKVQANFIDFSENVVVDQDNFFIELEMEFKMQEVSSAFMDLEAISKNNRFFGNLHSNESFDDIKKQTETVIYTIVDENEEHEDEHKNEALENQHKEKIDKLLQNFDGIEKEVFENNEEEHESEIEEAAEEQSEEDDDYFTKLESQAD